MTDTNRLGATRVIIGVDTHRDEHVAVQLIALAPGWVSSGCHPVPVVTKPSTAGRQG